MIEPNTMFTVAPPPGYRQTQLLRYPVRVLNLAAAGLLIITAPLLYAVTWCLQGQSVRDIAFPLTLWDGGAMLLVGILTIVVHEYIHGAIMRHYGYRVSYGVRWRLLMAYAGAFNQVVERRHALQIVLAPLLVMDLALLPLLAVANHFVIVLTFSALLINTTGAVGDLYMAWRLLLLPHQALVYDADPLQMLIFIPLVERDVGV